MDLYDIIFALAIVVSLVIVSEALAKFADIPDAILRKLVHVGSGLSVVCVSLLVDYHVFIVVGLLTTAFLYFTHQFRPLKSMRDRFNESQGEVYFGLGVTAVAIFSTTPTMFIACMLPLALSDTAAFLFGKTIPSIQVGPSKTLAGFLGCLVVTAIIFLLLQYNPVFAIFVAVVVAMTELISLKGTDNLAIPVVCLVMLSFFG